MFGYVQIYKDELKVKECVPVILLRAVQNLKG